MKKIFWCLMVLSALAAGCANRADHDHDHEGHDHAGHDHAAENPAVHGDKEHDHAAEAPGVEAEEAHAADESIVPAAQAALAGLEVHTVEPGAFTEVIRTSGQILAAQGDEVTLTAPVGGIVSFAGAQLADGAAIGRGQNVFYISSKNIATGDVQAVTEAAYVKARSDFERAQKLLVDKIVSQREYDEAKFAYEQARAQYDALAGARSARGTAVSAPIGGYLAALSVREGDYVEMGRPLAVVSQDRRLVLRVDVSQKYYSQLGQIRSANFRGSSNDEVVSLAALNGRLLSVGKSVGAGSYLIPVTFEFDNRGGVVPGSFVEVWLQGAPLAGVLSVPVEAVTEQQGVTYVYVQLDEEGYQRREVRTGATDGERVRILSGLEPGERVVTKGAVHVRMATASAIPGHTHNH